MTLVDGGKSKVDNATQQENGIFLIREHYDE